MIGAEARRALEEAVGDAIRFEVPTSSYTSLRVGGPAAALAIPPDRTALAELLRACARVGLSHAVLGNGFNTLVRDGGFPGVLIRLSRFRRIEERPGGVLAEVGISHHRLTVFCQERGLGGLEFGAGIPGTVGGWIAMNAGVPERETADAVREIEVMSPTGRQRRRLPRSVLQFRYRGLRGLAPGSVILSALFDVRISDPSEVKAEIERQLARRARTQPLDLPSCGSVFKNPPGDFAGRLIEAAGLKGAREGGAEISTLHANFVVNQGGATATDVLRLIELARRAVREQSGVLLEPEVRILGEDA